MSKKLIIGSDHAGYLLKNKLFDYLKEQGFEIVDAGTYSEESCDYPVIARDVANKIVNGNYNFGILVCGTGVGMSIVANKVKGIRAAVVSDTCSAKLSRQHNNANILCIGSRIVGESLAKDIVDIWISTDFAGERHQRRVSMIE